MEQDHPAKSGLIHLGGASRNHIFLMTPRNLQLHNPKQSHDHQQAEKRDDA
jgi:hypothetical protein